MLIYIAAEKQTLVGQLTEWFADYGVPIVALREFSSETCEREIAEDVQADGRPARFIYAGDLDPSGEEIAENFQRQLDRRGVDYRWIQVAVLDQAGRPVRTSPQPREGVGFPCGGVRAPAWRAL